MDFLAQAAACDPKTAKVLTEWWNDVTCPYLKKNIQSCSMFPSPGHPTAVAALTQFASLLQTETDGNANERATRSLDKDPSLLCCGPPGVLPGPLWRLHALGALLYNFSKFPTRNPAEMALYLESEADFNSYLNGTPFRGKRRVLFWTTRESVEGYCVPNLPGAATRFRQVVGVAPDPIPAVLIEINGRGEPFEPTFVPTGIDGFDHLYFLAASRPPTGENPRHGTTRDLGGSGNPGVPEVVTREVEHDRVRFVMILQ
jgi:hypothetical protein